MKTFTADEFRRNPAPVYRAADKDGEVRVNHSQYKDVIFTLTARDRQPIDRKEDSLGACFDRLMEDKNES